MIAFVRRSYSEITDLILSQITKGIVNEKHDYTANRIKYRLAQPEVQEIVRIDGTVRGAPYVFQKDSDYRLSGNTVEWLQGEKPDNNTPFFVNYKLDGPQEITDINPGSVVRTIVESVALEIDYLYAQLNQVYESGFIDTATGKSLDLVVSMLGINRKEAGFATGEVTLGRNSEPGEVEVSREAHVYNGTNLFELKNSMVKTVTNIEGTADGEKTDFVQGKDFALSDGAIEWMEGGRLPDTGSVFYIDYVAYEQILIPVDTRVSTYSRRPENIKVFRSTRGAYLTQNDQGRWEIDVPVVAMSPGKEGNVFAGTINVMPKPPIGIEYVINKSDIMNGTDQETDTELRERAKRALEMAGKATLVSLNSAVESVPGVIGRVKVVDQPDGVPGIVQIIASGGDDTEIERVIEETRSAGIKVEFKRPRIVPLDIQLTIAVTEGVERDDVREEASRMVREYLSTLNIDEDIVLSRIIKSVLSVQGVRDVKNVTINGSKENVEMKLDEKGELRTLEIFLED